FFFSSSRRHTRFSRDWSSDVCSSDLPGGTLALCRTWAQETGCALLGPRAFGAQRPHAGLNLSQHPTLARSGRVALVAQSRSITEIRRASRREWAQSPRAAAAA